MLVKLFKYDFKSLGRIIFPLYLTWIAISVLMGLTMRFIPDSEFFTLVMSFIYSAATLSSVVVTILLIISRYIKSIFGDEAYLMHTLPVKTSSLLWSKSLSATIFGIIGIIFGLLSATTIGFVVLENPLDFFEGMGEVLQAIQLHMSGKDIFTVFLMIVLAIIGLNGTINKVFAGIAVGYSFNKYKIAYSLVALIGFGVVELIVSSIGVNILDEIDILLNFFNSPISMLLILIALAVIQSGIYFLLTHYFMKNKLNLE